MQGVSVFGMGSDGSPAGLLALGAGFVGLILSPIAEILIVKCIPRLGALPILPIRITTATLTALVCAAFSLRFGMSFALPAFIFLGILGIQLARIDISLHLLPNPLVLALLVGGLTLFLMPGVFDKQADNLLRALLGAVILFVGYLILGLISPRGIGMGDV
jgi:leader peptidase (prepilin peptidase)/N-methyltransferase